MHNFVCRLANFFLYLEKKSKRKRESSSSNASIRTCTTKLCNRDSALEDNIIKRQENKIIKM